MPHQTKHIEFYPIKGIKTFAVTVRIKAGSWYEPGPSWGAFHLLEHCLAGFGTVKFPQADEAHAFAEENCIELYFSTAGSEIVVDLKAPVTSFTAALTLLEQRLFYPVFDSVGLDNEKKVVLQEYQDKWSGHYTAYYRQLDSLIYGSHHLYIRDGIGQPECFANITISDLTTFHQQYFNSENMFFGVCGNLSRSQVFESITAILNRHSGSPSILNIPSTSFTPTTYYFPDDHSQTAWVNWIWPTFGVNNSTTFERMQIALLKHLLGDGYNSRFFKSLRRQHGLVYRITVDSGRHPTAGYFLIRFSLDPQKYPSARDLLQQEIDQFINHPISADEFTKAISYLNRVQYNGFDSPGNIASLLSSNLYDFGHWVKPETYIKLSRQFSESSLRQFFSDIIKAPRLTSYISPQELTL